MVCSKNSIHNEWLVLTHSGLILVKLSHIRTVIPCMESRLVLANLSDIRTVTPCKDLHTYVCRSVYGVTVNTG